MPSWSRRAGSPREPPRSQFISRRMPRAATAPSHDEPAQRGAGAGAWTSGVAWQTRQCHEFGLHRNHRLSDCASIFCIVRRTRRFEIRRGDIAASFWNVDKPFVAATWHGQNLILPPFWHNWREWCILVSKHGDGEIVDGVMRHLGVSTIRGAGVPKGEERSHKHKGKGGAGALRAMVRQRSARISPSASPPISRRVRHAARRGDRDAGAVASGCPIVPVAATTRARIKLNNWDNFTINLPFSVRRAGLGASRSMSNATRRPRKSSRARRRVEDGLNAVAAGSRNGLSAARRCCRSSAARRRDEPPDPVMTPPRPSSSKAVADASSPTRMSASTVPLLAAPPGGPRQGGSGPPRRALRLCVAGPAARTARLVSCGKHR